MDKIAFVFAGQGAQKPGMGKDLYDMSPAAREVFLRGEQVRPGTLRQLFEGSREELSRTANTQPCLFLTDWACAAAACEAGIRPGCGAGFSLGEIAAMGYFGMMDFEAAFRLVIRRGEWMDECAKAHPSAMAAVLRLSLGQVEELCREFPETYPVNYNCPGQTVVAMPKCHLEAFIEKTALKKGRALALNVSGGFHSPFMDEAAGKMKEYLRNRRLAQPRLPLYANRTAAPYEGSEEGMKALLSGQINSPVLWQKTIERMREDGATAFVEVGAGTTLSGLIQKTLPGAAVYHVADGISLREAAAALKGEKAC